MKKLPVSGSISELALPAKREGRREVSRIPLSIQIRMERAKLFPNEKRRQEIDIRRETQ